MYEKIAKALFEYLKTTEYRDWRYYVLVKEHEPFNAYSLYTIELNDSPEESYEDLHMTFDMDYDEGQDITIYGIYSHMDIRNFLLKEYTE